MNAEQAPIAITIDSREQGLATLTCTVVLFYTVFTGYASGLELTPC